MAEVKSYRDLIAWQKSMGLCRSVYVATREYPQEERYALAVQTRRAAVSVPSNIAEGWGRGNLGDYLRFLTIARGSLCEVETQLLLGQSLEYLTSERADALLRDAEECSRVLNGLIASLARIRKNK